MAIYTKRGDRGTTGLYGAGVRVLKSSDRIVALGTIDELNCQLGVVISQLHSSQVSLKPELLGVQQDLFEVAAEVATVPAVSPPYVCDSDKTRKLEKFIDLQEAGLPVLSNFIFPGGSSSGAALHMARSICRRAEREVDRLAEREDVNSNIAKYLNRLSDYLFMMARLANRLAGQTEDKWGG